RWRDITLKSTLKRVGVRSSSQFRAGLTRCHRERRRHTFAHGDPIGPLVAAPRQHMDGSPTNLANPSLDPGYRYWAFHSYSHHDEVWAHWLHACTRSSRHRPRRGRIQKRPPLPGYLWQRRLFTACRRFYRLTARNELLPVKPHMSLSSIVSHSLRHL